MNLAFQFVRGHGLSSGGISWFGGGEFSHVDYICDDGSCIGARADKIAGLPKGVQRRPAAYESWATRVVFTLTAAEAQKATFEAFLASQLGKPYDPLAIVGFIVGRAWRDTDAWICSELQCAALETAGIVGNLYLAANRITPNAFALVLSALGATVR